MNEYHETVITKDELNAAQRKVLERIESKIEYFDFYGHPEEFEIKRFIITKVDDVKGGKIWVSLITGMKNDNGTMAACLCRKRRFFIIGPRGGLTTAWFNGKGTFRRVSVFDLMNQGYTY